MDVRMTADAGRGQVGGVVPDEALIRTWQLVVEQQTGAVEEELARLLPMLIEVGYVEADDYTWRFTPKGVERAERLSPE